jgi:hypothetical protein
MKVICDFDPGQPHGVSGCESNGTIKCAGRAIGDNECRQLCGRALLQNGMENWRTNWSRKWDL